jgi:hypothetical protein
MAMVRVYLYVSLIEFNKGTIVFSFAVSVNLFTTPKFDARLQVKQKPCDKNPIFLLDLHFMIGHCLNFYLVVMPV